ncbi:GNAT family N-acetyltransferase [Streptomyces abyssomicinicus]|uniref:GNAT family N-acetyltransferase n=1 Tax=Streptomyces abyssomicinicus TaxID=574929 RepID=UPI001FE9C701|nr:GNAT family N-acetyltransferase [Streptomyces abyssomicinicus]
MPFLVDHALSPGPLQPGGQPSLAAAGAVPRPWREEDAPALEQVFRDPAIQRWNLRRADSVDEARAWITDRRRRWTDGSAVH